MMFFGTSGVLSHTLMHGPMATDSDSDSDSDSTDRVEMCRRARHFHSFIHSSTHRRIDDDDDGGRSNARVGRP